MTEKKSKSIQMWSPSEFDEACAKTDADAKERLQSTADAAVRRVQGLLQAAAARHTRERTNLFPLRTSWSEIISGDDKDKRDKDDHLPANLRKDQPDRLIVEAEVLRQVSCFGWSLLPTEYSAQQLNKLPLDSLTLSRASTTTQKRG